MKMDILNVTNYIQSKLQILECHEEIILDTFQKNMGKLCIFRDIN